MFLRPELWPESRWAACGTPLDRPGGYYLPEMTRGYKGEGRKGEIVE